MRIFLFLLGLLPGAAPAEAHGMNASYTELVVTSDRVDAVYLLAVDEIAAHFPVAAGPAGPVTLEQIARAAPAVHAFLEEHVRLVLDERAVVLEPRSHRAHASGTFIRFEFSGVLARPPAAVEIAVDADVFERFGADHINFVRFAADDAVQQAVLTRDSPRASFSTGYRPLLAQSRRFIGLGIEHIFLGFDHILFLFALVIVGGNLRQLVAIVSVFTVAHSLTLVVAALQVVTLPARLIEGSIALTIAYVAFDNFFVAPTAPRWVLTFCFGLVHGFGFANVLRQIGLPRSQLVPTLLSFNIGVEIGQVLIIAVLFPLTLWVARQHYRRHIVAAASGVIFLFGVVWFVQRAFDLSFLPD